MASTDYDYAIIGAGAAGLQLALAFIADPTFSSKRICLIEKDRKDQNDRTWCYWEKGEGTWDNIVSSSWRKGAFISNDRYTALDLGDYVYKKVRAIDFYRAARKAISESAIIDWVEADVQGVSAGPRYIVHCGDKEIGATHVFDSRIHPDFSEGKVRDTRLLQHFKGWEIETTKPVFDVDCFTMMDFRLKYPGSTSFTYVLPESPTKALVEFTFFSPSLVSEEVYDDYLNKYLTELIGLKEYAILETEMGIIPMTDYRFEKHNEHGLTKIGTAGGWVKASSGYSFKNAERNSAIILQNLRADKPPTKGMFKRRFKTYDRLFLDVLFNHNELGEQIFTDMYTKNHIGMIFSFLDEQTSIPEELRIINSFKKKPFTKALLKQIAPFTD